jgi:pimeloyl-ACP methyl ester carboxylesterase
MTRLSSLAALTFALGLTIAGASSAFAQLTRPPARPAAPKTWTDHTFAGSDGTRFHYVEQGSGTPVILIHGLTSSAVGGWFNTGIAQRLAKTNRVIALDMRGHGETGPSPADSKGTMANDVVELLNHLGIQKAHIGGYSMGGATTAALLTLAPERFITGALMGIGVREKEEWLGKTPADPAPAAGSTAPRPATTLRADGVPAGAPPGAPVANQDVDLTTIKFPILSINGSLDNPLTKTHRMWRELEDYTYVVVPGKNHMQTPGDPLMGEKLTAFIVAHNP